MREKEERGMREKEKAEEKGSRVEFICIIHVYVL